MFQRRVALHPLTKLREALWPRMGWRRVSMLYWRRVRRLNGSPHSVALGMAIGAFMGCSPYLGFHIVGAMLFAWVFRSNIVAAVLGTNVGNPITYPPIWWASYDLGNWIMGVHPAKDVDLVSTLMSSKAFDVIVPFLVPMAIGSIPIGLCAALITYVFTRSTVAAYQKRRREKLEEMVLERGTKRATDKTE
ncbi:MAG: DUF2062 domain-containing protein [Parvibaculaceae bacterium]